MLQIAIVAIDKNTHSRF